MTGSRMRHATSDRLRHRQAGKTAPIVLFVVVGLTIAAVAWGITRLNDKDTPENTVNVSEVGSWYTVRPRSFDIIISSSGELDAANRVEMKSKVEGNTTIVEILPEGTAVEKGDVVIRLADDKIKEALETESLSVEQARADRQAADEELTIEQNEADNTLKAAQVKLELAKLDLAKWKSGDDPQKKRELDLALEKAIRTLKRAKENHELSKQLYAEEFISKSEVEDDELAEIEAEDALKTARLDIEVYSKYTRPKEHKKVLSDVEQAQAELDRTIRRNESKIAQAKVKLAGKIKQLKIREERLAKREEQLRATVMAAPQDGLVVYGTTVSNRRGRGDPIAPGRQVHFNETLVLLPDTSRMVAKLKVHESLVSRVKLGQKVTLRVDARPNNPLEGEICEIGVMAQDGGWLNRDLREYAVKVELPIMEDSSFKPAMRCVGQVNLGRVANQLAVPIQAVFTEGRQRFCYVPASEGRVRKQPVRIGRSSEGLVEIVSGLEDGERILMRQPRPGEVVEDKPSIAAKEKPQNKTTTRPAEATRVQDQQPRKQQLGAQPAAGRAGS